ncbi:MAG TPA: LuxR C-terminal-related transcriptional regulator, partial [Candidatus Limnocylindrales bacterium]
IGVMPVTFTSARFIGRERELVRFAEVLEGAAGGRTRTLLLAGTGGVGVSRMIEETARRVGEIADPFVVVRCPARSGWRAEPYAPVVAGLGPILARLDDAELVRVLGPGIEALARLMPDLNAHLVALGAAPHRPSFVAPERRQARVLEAVLGVLERVGERSPVLFVLEDLHVADVATRALAVFLARISRPSRVCVVVTYQPDELTRDHPLRDDLTAIGEATPPPDSVELDRFRRDELAELVAGLSGERPTASTLLLVAERSRGIPLVAEEIVAARRELKGVSLAGSLDELVIARLAPRSPECRRLLRLLAPAEQPLIPAELAAVAEAYEELAGGLPIRSTSAPRRGDGILDADMAAGLAEAIEHGFVVRVQAVPGGGASAPTAAGGALGGNGAGADRPTFAAPIRFRHALIARAVVADLLPGQRRLHQAALGAALDARPARSLRHWLAAYEPTAARSAALAAAELAESVDAPGDALAAFELAIELESHAEAPEGRREGAALRARASEAAIAAGHGSRAIAFLESAISRLDERADRADLALLYERLGRYRRVVGDPDGSLVALRRAVAFMPREPSRERVLVLGSLAQGLMLDGHFVESERIASEAIEVAKAVEPEARGEAGHAICTLGIGRAWGRDPEGAVALLEEARDVAAELGRPEDRFRAIANLTTALELLGRRSEAIDVALAGIDEARRLGLETVFGNFVRGNVADVLFSAGRWDEARSMSRTALEWSPAGAAFVDAAWSLAAVEVESHADEAAAHLLGRLLLELETVPDSQYVVPASRTAASFALWRGDAADAARAAELGWSVVRRTEDWVLTARMAATMAEVQASLAADARERRDLATVAAARGRVASVVAEADAAVRASGVAPTEASRQEAEAYLATAHAYRARLDGRDSPAMWSAIAGQWEAVGVPYQVARALWREAEAALPLDDARSGRPAARRPLREAARIAQQLGARPLLRELGELAARALISLPVATGVGETVAAGQPPGPAGRLSAEAASVDPDTRSVADGHDALATLGGASAAWVASAVDAAAAVTQIAAAGRASGQAGRQSEILAALVGSQPAKRADTFGLSSREREVLALIVHGRTNREIGERLFISQKTVGVHVGNILAKLGVSGRVEAATVAIRLELTGSR